MGARDGGPSKPNCDNMLPLAILLTFFMMVIHPIQTWRIIRDGE